jgi:phosphatidylinositol glycan class B
MFDSFLLGNPKLKYIVIAGLLVHIIIAFTSVGFHHPDEHFQILEFANYKLGFSSAEKLTWEFGSQIRSGFQPLIVYLLGSFMINIGFYNPFILALFLRLISSLFSFFVCLLVIKRGLPFFEKENHKFTFVFLAMLLWFIPYIGCRFSGENWSGMFFFCCFYFSTKENPKGSDYLFGGILGGLAFLCRFQIAFAIIGLFTWMFLMNKSKLLSLFSFSVSLAFIVLMGVLIDFWLYDQWVFSPYNYFHANIIKGVAAKFGICPWWYYFQNMMEEGWIISLIIHACIILSTIAYYKKPAIWVFWVFLIGHISVGHKEARFMFPMVYLVPLCVTYFLGRWDIFNIGRNIKLIRLSGSILCIYNLILLGNYVFNNPPNRYIYLYEEIYNLSLTKDTKLYYINDYPSDFNKGEMSFYKSCSYDPIKLSSIQNLDTINLKNGQYAILYTGNESLNKSKLPRRFSSKLLYQRFPNWVLNLNINNWTSRVEHFRLYKLTKKR